MTVNVAIVIPFFQREPGILSKALASVFEQKGITEWAVYIVDDESPVSPEKDISGFDQTRIHVIRQKNKGCGAARNTALERLPAEIKYVALLDSDDTWSERHLINGVSTLEQGFDFYFSNHYQLGQTVGAFERDQRLDLSKHKQIDGAIFEYCGDMYDQVIRRNLMGPSTNIYNFAQYRDIRFREGFRSLGEEYCFWLDVSRRGAKFAFSTECEVTYGSGVNIYSVAPWGSGKSLIRTHDEILFWKLAAREYPMNRSQLEHLERKINRLRDGLVKELFHQLRTANAIPKSLLANHVKRDPQILNRVFPALVGSAMQKLGRRVQT